MGAISKYGNQLIGKCFFFRYGSESTGYIDVVGKIESVVIDNYHRYAHYSLVYPGLQAIPCNAPPIRFGSGSDVDRRCLIFNESGSLMKFFKLFFETADCFKFNQQLGGF